MLIDAHRYKNTRIFSQSRWPCGYGVLNFSFPVWTSPNNRHYKHALYSQSKLIVLIRLPFYDISEFHCSFHILIFKALSTVPLEISTTPRIEPGTEKCDGDFCTNLPIVLLCRHLSACLRCLR